MSLKVFSAAYINTPLGYKRGKTKLSFASGEITRIQFIVLLIYNLMCGESTTPGTAQFCYFIFMFNFKS